MSENKNNPPKVSVIVPVYNVEKYIERCFWSVVSQTFRDFECIFIDDCGTDNSAAILMDLISSYKGDISLSLIRHENNKGLSAARNSGMDAASGTFLLFVDSDDVIFPDALKNLISVPGSENYDFICGRSLIMKNGKVFLSKATGKAAGNIDYFHKGLAHKMSCSSTACNRLYRKSFLENNNIRFSEGRLHEDILFNAEVFIRSPRLLETECVSYFYDIRENSITTSFRQKDFEEEIVNVELLKEIMTKNNLQNDASAIRLIVQRTLRLLIISRDYEKPVFFRAFNYVHSAKFRREEWNVIPFRHKLLYAEKLMPEMLALWYANLFVGLYRMFFPENT